LREVRRWIERRMQAANSEREVGRRTPPHTHGHIASQSKLVQQTRVMQRGIERGRILIEVDHTNRVQLQAHQFTIGSRQDGEYLSENQQPRSGAKLQHERDIGGDEWWRAPGDLDHRAEEIVTRSWRKESTDVAENLRRIAHGISGKHHAVERVRLEPGA